MIEAADKYEEQLKFTQTLDSHEFIYFNIPSEFVRHSYVSTHEGDIIGLMKVSINIKTQTVLSVAVLSLTENKSFYFAKDIMNHIRYLMYKYRKVSIYVLEGNPAEKTYDRIAKILKWRIVGTFKKEVLNKEGKWVDIKSYEFLNPNWREDVK